MSKLIRQTVYFLMITLVINAGGWTFNKEAVTDVWFDEQRSLAVDDGHSSSGHEDLKAVSHQSTCNHWCHAVGHFVGLLGQSISVLPEFVDEYSVQQPPFFQFLSPDARFRPPRLLF